MVGWRKHLETVGYITVFLAFYRAIFSLEAPNTLGKVFQNLEKRIQVCLDVK
jgi:hypothetical protein